MVTHHLRLPLHPRHHEHHQFPMERWVEWPTVDDDYGIPGSCIVYVTVLGLVFWRPQLRRIALAALISYWFYYGVWDVSAFPAGLYLAETRLLSEANSTDEEFKSPHQSPRD